MMKIVGLDGIKVKYIQHCGSDLTPVQAARVSTGLMLRCWMIGIKGCLSFWLSISILLRLR